VRAGLPVPPGFVVEVGAYRAFIEQTGLRDTIMERTSGLDMDETNDLDTVATSLRSEINATPIPGSIQQSIARAYYRLGSPGAIVRSSMTKLEDEDPFIGSGERMRHVRGKDGILRSVRHCWASLFTSQNIRHAYVQGRQALSMDMAVIVQRDLDAHKAGRVITMDPDNGAANRMVIEAALGIGTSAAGWSAPPDRYVVHKASGSLLSARVEHKDYVFERNPGDGTSMHRVPKEDRERRVLSDTEVRLLTRLGLRADRQFGSPQNLEWLIDPDGATWAISSTSLQVR